MNPLRRCFGGPLVKSEGCSEYVWKPSFLNACTVYVVCKRCIQSIWAHARAHTHTYVCVCVCFPVFPLCDRFDGKTNPPSFYTSTLFPACFPGTLCISPTSGAGPRAVRRGVTAWRAARRPTMCVACVQGTGRRVRDAMEFRTRER